MLDVIEEGQYSIKASTNAGPKHVYENKKIDDMVYFGEEICYTYYVNSKNSDLLIKFETFSGLYSYNVSPENLKDK